MARAVRSLRTNRLICGCGKGYASEYDGLCYRCRGDTTAWEQKRKDEQLKKEQTK